MRQLRVQIWKCYRCSFVEQHCINSVRRSSRHNNSFQRPIRQRGGSFIIAEMGFVQGRNVYGWKESLFGKPSFKPYRLLLYGNGRLLLEKQDSEKLKASGNLRHVFPYIRVGCLESEKKRDRAAAEELTLAYHTLIIPLESSKGWQEKEYAVSFDREIKEWMQSFAQVLSFSEQFEEVVRKYHEANKKRNTSGANDQGEAGNSADGQDAVRLWSTARGTGDDYTEIWSSFLDHCSARMESHFSNGRANSVTSCLAFH